MDFIESYKRLEKLCRELLDSDKGVSAYIDAMIKTPRGSYRVPGWDDDLKRLKHYRWVRNQIAHEPNCMESNMCHPGDVEWLDAFHKRIMDQRDPLALYARAIKPRPTVKQRRIQEAGATVTDPWERSNIHEGKLRPRPLDQSAKPKRRSGCLFSVIGVLAVVAFIILIGVMLF